MSEATEMGEAEVVVSNVGGVTDARVTLSRGTTVVVGDNASNKTSMLRAIAGALGGSDARLRSDADSGRVQLTIGGETYERRFEQRNGTVLTDGTPYVDDEDVVDLFVSLLESNPIRQAVRAGDELRGLLMTPVDETSIQDEIRSLTRERSTVTEELSDARQHRDRLPSLRDRRRELEDDLESVVEELASLRAEVEDIPASADGETADELETVRRKRNRVQEQIDRERTTIEALNEERTAVEAELEELSVDEASLADIETELERAERRSEELNELITDVRRVASFTENLLDDDRLAELADDEGGDPVAALNPSATAVDCFVCGSSVERETLETQLDDLRQTVADKRDRREEINERIRSLRRQRTNIVETVDTREELDRRLDQIDAEVDRRETRIEELEGDVNELQARVDELETELPENEATAALIERQERVSELEYERGRLETEIGESEEQIREAERRADEVESLQDRREEIDEELTDLRSRIEDLERRAVDEFNEHAAALVEQLSYENVERVWIERKRDESGADSRFDLHVVRESDSGAVYEDTVETLSESEREVVGLTVALAGHLTHDIGETVPVVLLDSLEAVDSERIATLVEYFAARTDYVVAALLPEDRKAVAADHEIDSAEELS